MIRIAEVQLTCHSLEVLVLIRDHLRQEFPQDNTETSMNTSRYLNDGVDYWNEDLPVNVCLFIVHLFGKHFWSHIQRTAYRTLLLLLLDPGQTEICHLGYPVLIHENILSLEVKMPVMKLVIITNGQRWMGWYKIGGLDRCSQFMPRAVSRAKRILCLNEISSTVIVRLTTSNEVALKPKEQYHRCYAEGRTRILEA